MLALAASLKSSFHNSLKVTGNVFKYTIWYNLHFCVCHACGVRRLNSLRRRFSTTASSPTQDTDRKATQNRSCDIIFAVMEILYNKFSHLIWICIYLKCTVEKNKSHDILPIFNLITPSDLLWTVMTSYSGVASTCVLRAAERWHDVKAHKKDWKLTWYTHISLNLRSVSRTLFCR